MNVESLKITHELLGLIAELDEFKGTWRTLGVLEPERLSGLRRVATIESVGSSTRIEGSKLSDKEVERLLSKLAVGSFTSRDEQEVAGYAEVMELIFASWEHIPLTENYLGQLHSVLLKYSDKDESHRGKYKKLSNNVEAFDADGRSLGVVFATTSPFDTPREMTALLEWAQAALAKKEQHPLLIAGFFIVTFLGIHPYQDGNGRLSRILTTLLLLKGGYGYVPYSSLESVIEHNREAYYLALRRTQHTLQSEAPDWQPWLLYFLRALQKQKRNLEAKIAREKIMLGALPQLSVKILELVQAHGRATTAELLALTDASRGTLKDHLSALVRRGYLVRNGKGRGVWYGRG